MGFAEQLLGVPMCLVLIFSGKVQVDIRRFITVKAQKSLKGNVVSVPMVGSATFRTVFGRQIEPGAIGAIGNKLAMFTMGANVVGRQRIDL